eukprot:COSAG02_NODE_605_length_19635_cov_7.106982_7_plen_205_part_00
MWSREGVYGSPARPGTRASTQKLGVIPEFDRWMRRGAGYYPSTNLANNEVSRLRCVDVVDSATGEPASDGSRGQHLRILGHGGCSFMVTDHIRRYTVRNGRDALQGTHHGAVGPMVETAQALALAESDVADAMEMVLNSRWDALTRDFWWRGVMMSRDRFSGTRRLMCQCCETAISSFRHTCTNCDLSRGGGQMPSLDSYVTPD